MLVELGKKIFGSRNSRLLKKYQVLVDKINALEPSMRGKSDSQLQALSLELKRRYKQVRL